VILRPAQAVNEKANMQMNILQAAGLYDPQQSIQDQFQIVTTRLVNLEQVNSLMEWMRNATTSAKASKDPSMNRVLCQAKKNRFNQASGEDCENLSDRKW
jgi:Na+-transporting NADH:ubiquinone oxidoreductase subunit C